MAITRTLPLNRIGLAFPPDTVGADSNLIDLSTALGAAIDAVIFHFRSPLREIAERSE
jgi:hypothetical protein